MPHSHIASGLFTKQYCSCQESQGLKELHTDLYWSSQSVSYDVWLLQMDLNRMHDRHSSNFSAFSTPNELISE